jgi:hypothetical protein
VSNDSSIVACVFVAAVTFLLSPCLATIGSDTYKHTDRWKRFMRDAIEMGSGAMIYMPSFIKTDSGIQMLMWRIHKQHGDLISLLLFFQTEESKLKNKATAYIGINVFKHRTTRLEAVRIP